VVADIPGLIEGAHTGAGLGTQFLRHVERTRLLVHLVDVAENGRPDPVHDYEVIMNELASFGAGLEDKPVILVASRIDAAQTDARVDAGDSPAKSAKRKSVKVAAKSSPESAAEPAKLAALRKFAKRKKLEFHAISAVTGEGVEELKYALGRRVQELRAVPPEPQVDAEEVPMPRRRLAR